MQTYRITEAGPLLDMLTAVAGNRTRVKQWFRLRRIVLNGQIAEQHDQPVIAGDTVTIGAPQIDLGGQHVAGIPVLFGDDSLIVVDKPAGLLTIATDTERVRTAYHHLTDLVKQLAQRGDEQRIFIVHRLDRETSGLLVFARTPNAKQTLQENWDAVEKRYFAIVEGAPPEASGTVESDLTETKALTVFSGRPTSTSKHAVTHYKVVKTTGQRSLLEVTLQSGRKHQIRVHLADIGCPVVGDDRYGRRRKKIAKPKRMGLHASSLKFPHPVTGEPREFTSPLPRGLSLMLKPSATA